MRVRGGIIHIVQVDGSKENVCFEYLSSGISNESRLLEDTGSLVIFPEVLWYKEKPAGIQTVVTGTQVHTSEPDERGSAMNQGNVRWVPAIHPHCPVRWTRLGKAQLLFVFMEVKLLN